LVEGQKRLTIKDWSDEDKPREKLLLKGAMHLSDAELLAILIREGTRNQSAVEVARQLLEKAGNDIGKLGDLTPQQISKNVKGIGKAKAVIIAAALEIGRRRKENNSSSSQKKITSSKDAYDYIYPTLADQKQELFYIVLLNRANIILGKYKISEGGMTGTVVDPKIIFRKVLDEGATSLIIAHNHPSGNNQPSQADIELTKKIQEAAKLLDVSLLDHLIFTNNMYFSFADEGLL
jgi:DNA repair protein RadC